MDDAHRKSYPALSGMVINNPNLLIAMGDAHLQEVFRPCRANLKSYL
jgi:hypothetical protein